MWEVSRAVGRSESEILRLKRRPTHTRLHCEIFKNTVTFKSWNSFLGTPGWESNTGPPKQEAHFTIMTHGYSVCSTSNPLPLANLVLVVMRLIMISKPSHMEDAEDPLQNKVSNSHVHNIKRIKVHNKHFIRVSWIAERVGKQVGSFNTWDLQPSFTYRHKGRQ